MLKVIELFAGIGAQRKGLERAGIEHEVVAISEIDKYALKVYETLYGNTPNLGDISKIEKLPKADMWTYSFPCTDISLSGRMKGLEKGSGTHSSLLWEVQRLLEVSKANDELPKYLLLENVKNLISKKFKPYFDEWCRYLESLGYKNFYKVLNGKNYNVPQNRERIFLLSIRTCDEDYVFPNDIPLTTKLGDLLESNVADKYFLSEKLITCFSSMKNRNGLIRGLRFRPRGKKDEYAWTITTAPGSRATDTFIIEPIPAAIRGRANEDGTYRQQLELKKDGNTNTLTTVQKDNVVIVPQNTKQGYAIAHVGDGIYTNRADSKRGVVQRESIQTLKTSNKDIAVVVDDPTDFISIRRLTPRECWRLMGWTDDDIDKAFKANVSETQLYKMAGNSIIVNCLEAIFKNIRGSEEMMI
jgi:DNA (cytosine-5)-methyltransferase 1